MITVQKLKIDIQQNWDQATSWPNRTVWSLSVPIEDSKGCEASAKKKRPHRGLRGQFSCKIIRIEKVRNHLLSVKRKPVKGIVGEKKYTMKYYVATKKETGVFLYMEQTP